MGWSSTSTLALIDTDSDHRVRAPEVIAAVQWCEDHLKDLSALRNGSDTLPLSQINDQTPSGKAILASARQILSTLARATPMRSPLPTRRTPPRSSDRNPFQRGTASSPPTLPRMTPPRRRSRTRSPAWGVEADRSGKPGINQVKVDAFFEQCKAYAEWASAAESDGAVRFLGDSTPRRWTR